MNSKRAFQQLTNLPPEAQQQVADFIAFLQTRYAASPRGRKPAKRTKLASEPFIGMWKDRDDLQDSSAWVRKVREKEWARRRG